MRGRFFSGNAGFVTAWILMSVMTMVSFPFMSGHPANGNGFCYMLDSSLFLPSVSCIAEWTLLSLISLGMVLINRKNNFIPTLTTVHASVFMLLCAACPVLSTNLSSSLIIAAMNLIALQLLYRAYKSNSANSGNVHALFFTGIIFAAGSLFQFVCVWYILFYICAAAVLKLLDIKSLLAMIAGVLTPLWIMCGLFGWPLPGFSLPEPGIQMPDGSPVQIFMLIVAAVGIILSFSNYFSSSLNNLQMRTMQHAMIIPGIGSCLLLALHGGQEGVSASVFMFTAYQVGYLSGLSHQKGAAGVLGLTLTLSVIFLILILNG